MSVSLEGRFAVLGYGSLIWDLDDLAPHVELPWAMGGGPLLPMEFSRISPKRKMGLLSFSTDNGVPCPTHAIASVKTTFTPSPMTSCGVSALNHRAIGAVV